MACMFGGEKNRAEKVARITPQLGLTWLLEMEIEGSGGFDSPN